MSENAQEIRDLLARLKQQVESTDDVDPQIRQTLESAIEEIQQTLDNAGARAAGETTDQEEAPEPIGQRLSEAVDHFDESHPTLASIIGGLIDALGRMGI